jgi:hypothetical protein
MMNLRACKINFFPRGARGKREIGARAVYIAASIQEADIRAGNTNACCWCVRHLQQCLLHSWKHMKFSESHYFLLMFLLMLRKKKQQPNSELPLNFAKDPTPDPTSVVRNPKKSDQGERHSPASLPPPVLSLFVLTQSVEDSTIPSFISRQIPCGMSPPSLSADHSMNIPRFPLLQQKKTHQECCLLLCADTFYSRFHPSIILQ